MAYFSNGTEGMVFDNQCAKCKYGMAPCPIAWVQMNYNYDQHNDKSGTATKILNDLVKRDGTCAMYELDKINFHKDPNQTELF